MTKNNLKVEIQPFSKFHTITIVNAHNGFTLINDLGTLDPDSNSEVRVIEEPFVADSADLSDIRKFERLFYEITDMLGWHQSKHKKYRLVLKTIDQESGEEVDLDELLK